LQLPFASQDREKSNRGPASFPGHSRHTKDLGAGREESLTIFWCGVSWRNSGGQVHWTTPGHSRSHGMIERLHGTLQEHLHILRIGRGMTGEEAWARALLAYNNSLHLATGYTPLELMRAWQREDSPVSIEYVCGELVDQDDRKKRDRVDRLNIKATDRWNRVQAGDYVFIKNWYRRRKTDPRFVGPFIVDTNLSRFRLKVKCVETGRVRVIHANESRPPRAQP
ncbi:hypothetical protein AAG570_009077, partial [Ranatra chinensis]